MYARFTDVQERFYSPNMHMLKLFHSPQKVVAKTCSEQRKYIVKCDISLAAVYELRQELESQPSGVHTVALPTTSTKMFY